MSRNKGKNCANGGFNPFIMKSKERKQFLNILGKHEKLQQTSKRSTNHVKFNNLYLSLSLFTFNMRREKCVSRGMKTPRKILCNILMNSHIVQVGFRLGRSGSLIIYKIFYINSFIS